MGFYVKHSQIIVLCFEGHLIQAFDCEFVRESPEGQNAEGYVKARWSLYKKDEKKTNAEMGIDNFEVCVMKLIKNIAGRLPENSRNRFVDRQSKKKQ